MDVKLILLVGSGAGTEIPVKPSPFLIGRLEECHLRPKSDLVSRRHCRIATDEGRVTIEDLRSRTGTWINGERIPNERAVQVLLGDKLKVGPLEFTVVIKHTVGGQKKPAVESMEQAVARTAGSGGGQGDDLDVSDWLQADEESSVLGETLSGGISPTMISAADLMSAPAASVESGGNGSASKSSIHGAAADRVDPRKAAEDALRKHLRRG